MFASKKAPDAATALNKFLDPKRDTNRRLRALHTAHTLSPASKRKAIFREHYSLIYFLFHDAFTNLEATIKVKGNRIKPLTDAQQAELLDLVLPTLEFLLIYVPEQVGKRWQANSLGLVIRKLLHSENQLTLRKKAIQLLLLWIQDLQKNCSDDIFQLFSSVIPAVITGKDDSDVGKAKERHPQSVFHVPLDDHDPISMVELIPILPSSDPPSEATAKELLNCILDGMLLEFQRIQWEKSEQKMRGFVYLFEQFKRFYIAPLFPVNESTPRLYTAESDQSLPVRASSPIQRFTSLQQSLRNMIVRWLLDLIKPVRRRKSPSPQSSTSSADGGGDVATPVTPGPPGSGTEHRKSITYHLSVDVSTLSAEERRSHGKKLLRYVLMSLKDNIELMHNVCYQAFHLPFTYVNTIRSLVFLYLDWTKEPNLRPVFMRDATTPSILPSIYVATPPVAESASQFGSRDRQLSMVPEEDDVVHGGGGGGGGGDESATASLSSSAVAARELRDQENAFAVTVDPSPEDDPTPVSVELSEATSNELGELETIVQSLSSEKEAGSIGGGGGGDDELSCEPESPMKKLGFREDVRAGLQSNLRLFVTHVATVFVVKPPVEFLDYQVDLCTYALNFFQTLARKPLLQRRTWEHLLATLLDVSLTVLRNYDPKSKKSSLGSRILPETLKTLLVSWIRANLMVPISTTLWDDLLEVLSSQTRWIEVIKEWARVMIILTRLLAKHVYGFDFSNLPLDALKQSTRRAIVNRSAIHLDDTKSKRDSFLSGLSNVPSVDKSSSVGNKPSFQLGQPSRLRAKSAAVPPSPRSGAGDSSLKSAREKAVAKKNAKIHENATRPQSGSDIDVRQSSFEGLSETSSQETDSAAPSSRGRFLRRSQTTAAEQTRPKQQSSRGENHNKPRRLISLAGVEKTDGPELMTAEKILSPLSSPLPPSPSSSLPSPAKDSPQLGKAVVSGGWKTIDMGELNRESALVEHRAEMNRSRSSGAENRDLNVADMKQAMLQTSIEDVGERATRFSDDDRATGESENESEASSAIGLDSIVPSTEESPELSSKGKKTQEISVVVGGGKRGWCDVAAAVLWRRMFGILGDINQISDPKIHLEAVECLSNVWDALLKLRENQGIMSEDGTPGKEPTFSPPLFALSATVFQAVTMPEEFKAGRLIAFKLMCNMFVRRHDHLPSFQLLNHFYRLMHVGLTTIDKDFLAAILSQSRRIFSLPLPGVSILIPDYIKAADRVLSSTEPLSESTRVSALISVGSLLFFRRLNCGMTIKGSRTEDGQPMTYDHVEEKILAILTRTAKTEDSVNGRSLALCQLGVYLHSELAHSSSQSIDEGIVILLQSVKLPETIVAMVAVDMIHLLSNSLDAMMKYHPHLPKLIVEALAYSIASLLDKSSTDSGQRVLIRLLTCLLEWVMLLPKYLAREPSQAQPKKSLWSVVIEVFSAAASGALVDEKASNYLSVLLKFPLSDAATPVIGVRGLKESGDANRPRSAPPVGSPADAFPFPPSDGSNRAVDGVVQLTARACFSHCSSLHGHYPFGCGATRLGGLVSERDDFPDCATLADSDIGPTLFNSPSVQFFSYKRSSLISVLELPVEDNNVATRRTFCRVLIRDTTGKFVWDAKILHGSKNVVGFPYAGVTDRLQEQPATLDRRQSPPKRMFSLNTSSFDPLTLPTHEKEKTFSPETDMLDKLLIHLGATSPECIAVPELALNEPAPPPESFFESLQSQTIDLLHSQDSTEKLAVYSSLDDRSAKARQAEPQRHFDPKSPFYHCLLLLSSIGYLTWEQRDKVDLLKKEGQLLRELKHLDSRQCRETHKIAVFYVARGQEDKYSIMANSAGSRDFEDFVAGLGWEVDLSTHAGFMGGLTPNTIPTAPYYSTSTTEVLFHVATRFPTKVEEGKQWWINKLKHLGNDEIQIVWSEHTRDYRSEIIKTEFGDVYIIIYPLPNHLFRIQVIKKPDVPVFGPLFDGAIVDKLTLPCLVRETALNASRAKRSQIRFYQMYFEERAKYIEATINRLRQPTTFEEFAARSVLPAALPSDVVPRLLITGTGSNPSSTAGRRLSDGGVDDDTDGAPLSRRPRASTVSDLRQQSPKPRKSFVSHLKSFNHRSSFPEGLNLSPTSERRRHQSERHHKT
ncbi:ral GTPase-activating protein subunit alpha-2-like [Oscarella lobularis]|uniref:ral GTPase-activating protein subunit alpha-2-like n=1 Tax=Oscarella lobularis TaxID=121494 RepID=UPI0033142008